MDFVSMLVRWQIVVLSWFTAQLSFCVPLIGFSYSAGVLCLLLGACWLTT